MAGDDSRRARPPAYVGKLLHRDTRTAGAQVARPPEELFLHLGYWSDPARAGTDYPELLAAQARLNERLLALSDLRDGLRVLDVGCGIGGTIASIGKRFHGMDLVGLNIDPTQLAVARASVQLPADNRCTWVDGDACALPFEDASFDRILAVECIFHFPSRRRFFAEAMRVLRPGGSLALSDFVATPSMRAFRDSDEYPGFALEAAIVPAVGPWPDFWGQGPGNVALAEAAGLQAVTPEDVTRATLPSYRCFLHGKETGSGIDASDLDPVDRAMVLMEWLHSRGHLRMELFAFNVAPPNSER